MITRNFTANLQYDFYPSDKDKILYIFIHGGGLVEGNRKEISSVCEKLSQKGISVACFDYRLFPNVKYPSYIEDAALAIKEIIANHPHKSYVIGGISAGAYIAMMISFDEEFLAKYDLSPSIFKKHIFDGGQSSQHFRVNEELGLPTWNQYITEKAPLFYLNKKDDLSNDSYLIFVADNDLPNRKQENIDLANILKSKNATVNIHIMNGYGHAEYKETDEYFEIIYNYFLKN